MANFVSGSNSLTKARTNGIRFAVNYNGCKLSGAEINEIFTGLGAPDGGSQTISISQNYGFPDCDTSIATGKGWTVA